MLASCSAGENLPPATATAQIAGIQHMATQMAEDVQVTSIALVQTATMVPEQQQATEAVLQQQATEAATAGLALLSQATNWRVVISDTFDNNNNQWTTGSKESDLSSEQLSIDKGSYNWTAIAKSGFVYWTTPTTDTVKDFYLAVDANQIDGPDDGDVSLVFHEADTSNFYLFEVSNLQKFSVYQLQADNWEARIDWTESSVIKKAQPNHLEVVGKGSVYYFFINGTMVGTYTEGDATQGSSGIGVSLYNQDDKGNFSFDNFMLKMP